MRALLLVAVTACAPTTDQRAVENNHAAWLHVGGALAEAETIYRDVLSEGFEPARLHLGICLRDQGRMDEALACLLDAQADLDGPFQLAVTYTMMGRHAEAAAIYLSLIDGDPLTLYNALASLDDAGVPVDLGPLMLAIPPGDVVYPYALELLARMENGRARSDLIEEANWCRTRSLLEEPLSRF